MNNVTLKSLLIGLDNGDRFKLPRSKLSLEYEIQFVLDSCKIPSPELMKQFFDEVNRGGKIETVVARITKKTETEFYSEFVASLTQ